MRVHTERDVMPDGVTQVLQKAVALAVLPLRSKLNTPRSVSGPAIVPWPEQSAVA